MSRLYGFLRQHPSGVDGCWALALLVLSLVYLEGAAPEWRGPTAVATPAAVALCAVVALRRRWPVAMLALATGAGLGQLVGGAAVQPANFAFFVIIYTVAASDTPRWASRYALLAGLLAPVLDVLVRRLRGEPGSTAPYFLDVVLLSACFFLAWVLGDSVRTRRAYYAELEQRAARLEREREARARIAVAAERARIARELHDVVTHNVSAIVVQADGAAHVLDRAPDQARGALRTISTTGRQALTDMRHLVGVLHTGDGERVEAGEAEGYVPQPGVEQLAELVDRVREAGLPVDFRVEGTPCPLPTSVELTAYRIVQEALANTRKHGGPQAGARVRLAYAEDTLTVLAEDDGWGAPQRERSALRAVDCLGHGLIGMRERVGMVGGELEAGPRPGGGFRINATLPLHDAGPAQAGSVNRETRGSAPTAGTPPPPAPRPAPTRTDPPPPPSPR